jgi:prolyl oligopeptidase
MNSDSMRQRPATGAVCEFLHGIEVEDPFRWLEEQDSPLTRSFIETEQNAYRAYLDRHESQRSRMQRLVTEMLAVETIDLPVPDHCGGLLYLKREAHEEQKAIYYRRGSSAEKRLLSIDVLGRDASTSLTIVQVSTNGRYLAFGTRTGGEDVQEIGFYDLRKQSLLSDHLARGFYRGMVFDQKYRGLYYAQEEAEGRYLNRRAVRWHAIGDDPANDREVYWAGDGPAVRLILQGSEDGSSLGYHIVLLDSIPQTRFLIHEFPLSASPCEVVRMSGTDFAPRFGRDTIAAATTYAAPRGRIVLIDPEHRNPEQWRSIIPEICEEIEAWERFGHSLVVHYTDGRGRRTRVYSASGALLRIIEYPVSGTIAFGRVDTHSHRLFYAHTDIRDPQSIYAADLLTGEHRLWWREPASSHRPSIRAEHRSYRSKDGTEIPITLVHPSRVEGVRPVLLSAYGAGGASTTPRFSVLETILAESEITCATAHVRGGGEGGHLWHRAAQRRRKQTSVDDLIAAAEWLVESGHTTPQLLGIAGQSAGALLALCAITQRPDLFRAAMALGPLADLTRFHLFGVAQGFVAELGSPDDPDEFAALHQLSPYHRIRLEDAYPAVLIISGDRDKRCDAMHARKMIARLKTSKAQVHPILLDYTAVRGHKPVLPLTERIRALADRLTFLIAELTNRPEEAPR